MAKSRVDEREYAKNSLYLSQLEQLTGVPGTEGQMGSVDRYFADLQTAAEMLAPYTGQAIAGTNQTYFSATPEQWADYTLNYVLGFPPSASIVPGMADRDLTRLENMAALNGSAVPVYPVEEAALGFMVSNRVQSVLGQAWSTLDVYLAGRVGVSAGGNISTQQVTREGMMAGLNAMERAELSNLTKLASTTEQGALREQVTNGYFARNGYTQLEGKCGSNNCFDGVFIKGDTVYVVETKPLQVNGAIKLNGPEGNLPTQMSPEWIEYAAKELAKTSDPVKQQTAALILQADKQGSLVKIVAGVNENGVTLVKLAK